MATANHVLLRRITLTASASSVTFDSIPQTGYTDLKIVGSARSTRSANGDDIRINFNGSNTNFSGRRILGTGSSAFSATMTSQIGIWNAASDTANTYGNFEVYIPNYNQAIAHSYSADTVNENNATAAYAQLTAGLWSPSTAQAITSVTFLSDNGFDLVAGSSFSLYGIADVNTTPKSAPKADGGDIIKTDGTYWYHAFTSTGSFKPQLNLTADILQIAGGGGSNSGGGGAGGLLGFASQALTLGTAYTATVGAGGAAATQGGDSQFASLTASVGGGAGGNPPGNGGSGGGSAGYTAASPYGRLAGGTATSGQGYAGGSGYWGGPYNGGGGGGAGAVGQDSPGNGGAGGIGSSAYSSWGASTGTGQNVSGTYYYAGGGGGAANLAGSNGYTFGVGGYGGGGNGNASNAAGVAGTANTGGGGGGSDAVAGVTGGSGIIIIRYPVA